MGECPHMHRKSGSSSRSNGLALRRKSNLHTSMDDSRGTANVAHALLQHTANYTCRPHTKGCCRPRREASTKSMPEHCTPMSNPHHCSHSPWYCNVLSNRLLTASCSRAEREPKHLVSNCDPAPRPWVALKCRRIHIVLERRSSRSRRCFHLLGLGGRPAMVGKRMPSYRNLGMLHRQIHLGTTGLAVDCSTCLHRNQGLALAAACESCSCGEHGGTVDFL